MTNVTIKRCSNPICTRRERIYLNGATTCAVCGSPLASTQQATPDNMAETLDQMAVVHRDLKQLLLQTSRGLGKVQ
jgi:hypothetical protein